jgi:hypothetical protein
MTLSNQIRETLLTVYVMSASLNQNRGRCVYVRTASCLESTYLQQSKNKTTW